MRNPLPDDIRECRTLRGNVLQIPKLGDGPIDGQPFQYRFRVGYLAARVKLRAFLCAEVQY